MRQEKREEMKRYQNEAENASQNKKRGIPVRLCVCPLGGGSGEAQCVGCCSEQACDILSERQANSRGTGS